MSDDSLIEKLKTKIAIYNFKEEIGTLKNENKGVIYFMNKKIIATVCASLLLISSVVVAINIKNKNVQVRDSIETAINNGYIAKPNMDFIDFDDVGTQVKIKDFFMDDLNLRVNFLFKFNDDISGKFDSMRIILNDLIIRDEENRIIFGEYAPEAFEEYCKEHNLNYTYGEYNENYYACGLSQSSSNEIYDNVVELTYLMYSTDFPKSKKLFFSFENVSVVGFTKEHRDKGNPFDLKGSWCCEVDVPEIMYNRTVDNYKVISCDNEEIEILSAYATDVGFEIKINMNRKDKNKIIDMDNSYIEDEKGKRYDASYSVSRREADRFEGELTDWKTFEVTKYDVTDRMKVVLDYGGKPVNIQLEKII